MAAWFRNNKQKKYGKKIAESCVWTTSMIGSLLEKEADGLTYDRLVLILRETYAQFMSGLTMDGVLDSALEKGSGNKMHDVLESAHKEIGRFLCIAQGGDGLPFRRLDTRTQEMVMSFDVYTAKWRKELAEWQLDPSLVIPGLEGFMDHPDIRRIVFAACRLDSVISDAWPRESSDRVRILVNCLTESSKRVQS